MMAHKGKQESDGETGQWTSQSQTTRSPSSNLQILAELGRGGMANVYLAIMQGRGKINKLVVLKALRPELAREPNALSMFLDEARVAVQLNHPNVVQTYEMGNFDDRQVIVMEYLEGQSFARLVKECERAGRPLPLAVSLRVMIGVLEGLAYTHDLAAYDGTPLRLVHRDISPQNVFVTYGGQVKLLDFGIAKAASSRTDTATGILKGKFRYMAPEQMQGAEVDRRTDIYAAGCMLWTLAARKPLWHGVSEADILRGVVAGKMASPREVNPDCDEELDRIVRKATARRPEDRYQTAFELQADLEQYTERLGKPVKQKELAKLVSELFAQHRAEIRGLIEKQLSLQAKEAAVPMLQITDETGPDQRTKDAVSSLHPEPHRRHRLLTIGALVVVLVGGFAMSSLAMPAWFRHGLGSPESSSAVASPSTVPLPPNAAEQPSARPTPEQRDATVSFRIVPPDATLTLDGISLPPGSTSRVLPADGTRHTLAAEATAYHSNQLDFMVSGDMQVELVLSKSSTHARSVPRWSWTKPVAPAAVSAPTTATVATSAAVAAPAAAPEHDCRDPFFMDSQGFKHMRPECR